MFEVVKVCNGVELFSLKLCDYCVWGGLLLGNDNVWFDVMVVVKVMILILFFGKVLDCKVMSEVEYWYFLVEIVWVIMMGFMCMLEWCSGGV